MFKELLVIFTRNSPDSQTIVLKNKTKNLLYIGFTVSTLPQLYTVVLIPNFTLLKNRCGYYYGELSISGILH